MNVLHLGPWTSQHTTIADSMYRAMDCRAYYINTRRDLREELFDEIGPAACTNPWHGQAPERKRFGSSFLKTLKEAGRIVSNHNPSIEKAIRKATNAIKFDFVVATWGLPVYEAMWEAQRIVPEAAFIYNILTVPELPFNGEGVRGLLWRPYLNFFHAMQQARFCSALGRSDVRVHCSEPMRQYIRRLIGPRAKGADIVRIERFPREYHSNENVPILSDQTGTQHVAHIGATNFSGEAIDDVTSWLAEITGNHIHVHFNTPARILPATLERNPFVHPFPRFYNTADKSAFAAFLRKFDGVVILYNVDRSYERFINSLPTRFLFAVSVGIPVFVPASLFPACENYIEEHNIGSSFRDGAHLKSIISDKANMGRLRHNSIKHASMIALEDKIEEVYNIFQTARQVRDNRRKHHSLCR